MSGCLRVAAALQLMVDLRVEVALSLLISAPVWRCFRRGAQHEQSKREGESNEKEKAAAEKTQTLPSDESENRDHCVYVCAVLT